MELNTIYMFVLLFESNDVLLHIEFIARLRADSDSGEVYQTIQFYFWMPQLLLL